MALSVVFNPRHVQPATQYATERSEERGWPWASGRQWETSLRDHGVDHMSSGLILAVQRGAGTQSVGRSIPLDGGPGSESAALLETAEVGVRAACDALLS